MQITTIGLDIAKSVFQVHGIDAGGQVIVRRQLKRRYVLTFFQQLSPCLVGIEACGSAHHWSRELQALGHTVRLMPPAYVKPYVKRQKNDASGNVWDNAAMESFFSSLKTERTARRVYRSRDEAKADVFDYIERFYNPKRRHSTIGYLSPMEFEQQAGLA